MCFPYSGGGGVLKGVVSVVIPKQRLSCYLSIELPGKLGQVHLPEFEAWLLQSLAICQPVKSNTIPYYQKLSPDKNSNLYVLVITKTKMLDKLNIFTHKGFIVDFQEISLPPPRYSLRWTSILSLREE